MMGLRHANPRGPRIPKRPRMIACVIAEALYFGREGASGERTQSKSRIMHNAFIVNDFVSLSIFTPLVVPPSIVNVS